METGKNYTLLDIFSKDNKVIIPDLQREYCWPSEKNEINGKDLVTGFIDNLLKPDSSSRKLGLIYAYSPINNQIYLCDGQQRITTLYLLVGYLHRILKQSGLFEQELLKQSHDILISEFEEKYDDKEPRLQYAIRESTLLFLRDVVNQYFLGDEPSIKDATWFFDDYNQDPSIINMCKAIEVFDKVVLPQHRIDLLKIIMHNVHFMYFDMKSRTYGEEQYVVINTTGKSLTVSENYKPLFLKGLSGDKMIHKKNEIQYYADQWEDWEAFMWKFKPDEDNSYIVDKAMKEFFKWVYVIEKYNDNSTIDILDKDSPFDIFQIIADESVPQKNIKLFGVIGQYFNAIKSLNDLKKGIGDIYNERRTIGFAFDKLLDSFLQGKTDDKKINYIHLLPLIAYIKQSGKSELDSDFIRTIRFIINRSEDPDVIRNPSAMIIEAVKFIMKLNSYSPLDIVGKDDLHLSSTFLNENELFKLEVLNNNIKKNDSSPKLELSNLENSIWKADCLRVFRGDISQLFVMIDAHASNDDKISTESINKAITLIEGSLNKCDDLFRRALLTYGDYSIYTSWSYSLNAHKAQFVNSVEQVRERYLSSDKTLWNTIFVPFIIDLFNSGMEAEVFENSRINDYQLCGTTHHTSPLHQDIFFYKLIKEPDKFEMMRAKIYAYSEDEDKYWLLAGSRASQDAEELDYTLDSTIIQTTT